METDWLAGTLLGLGGWEIRACRDADLGFRVWGLGLRFKVSTGDGIGLSKCLIPAGQNSCWDQVFSGL